jgi:hypothetical protein
MLTNVEDHGEKVPALFLSNESVVSCSIGGRWDSLGNGTRHSEQQQRRFSLAFERAIIWIIEVS